jgi:hypothetical protein
MDLNTLKQFDPDLVLPDGSLNKLLKDDYCRLHHISIMHLKDALSSENLKNKDHILKEILKLEFECANHRYNHEFDCVDTEDVYCGRFQALYWVLGMIKEL